MVNNPDFSPGLARKPVFKCFLNAGLADFPKKRKRAQIVPGYVGIDLLDFGADISHRVRRPVRVRIIAVSIGINLHCRIINSELFGKNCVLGYA